MARPGFEVGAVRRLAEPSDLSIELSVVDPPPGVGDLFETRNFLALTVGDDAHEFTGFEQGVVRAGIEPRRAATEQFHGKIPAFKIAAVEVSDLQISTRRRFEISREIHDVPIVEI
jgi:hypothetical protein